MAIQKTILITGANKGIGYQIAKELGLKDHRIILTARNQERGIEALESLHKIGIDVTFVQMDVGQPNSILSAFKQISTSIASIDVLINNAGILLNADTNLLEMSTQDTIQTLKINALGPLWVTQTFMPLLSKGSRIVMVSSGAGEFCGGLTTWAPIYSISKTTLNAITRQLHVVLDKKGIITNKSLQLIPFI